MSGVLHLEHDVEIPALFVAGLILETFEWDADLELVPVLSQAALRGKHEILAEIGGNPSRDRGRPRAGKTLALLDDGAVHLHAERVEAEDVRLSVIVERAEQNLDVVVGGDLVAIRERRVHGSMRLER